MLNVNNEINENMGILHAAVLDESSTSVNELNEVIKNLVDNQFAKIANQHDQEQVKNELIYLTKRMSQKQVTESGLENNINNFAKMATALIKSIDSNSVVPSELILHPGYHGDVIDIGIKMLRELQEKDNITLDLRDFVREYCKDMFEGRNGYMYLLRPCSSVRNCLLNGMMHKFFVITYGRAGDLNHCVIAHVQNTENKNVKWHIMLWNPNRLSEKSYNNLEDLLKYEMKCYTALPPFGPEKMNNYARQYGDKIIQLLKCPISLSKLSKPRITEDGHTFSCNNLIKWKDMGRSNPLTRKSIDENKLRQNVLAEKLVEARTEQLLGKEKIKAESLADWKNDPILKLFEDPITHEMMTNPVIATDNITYDKASLVQYLKSNENKLPDGTSCTPEQLYINRVAEDVLEQRLREIKIS